MNNTKKLKIVFMFDDLQYSSVIDVKVRTGLPQAERSPLFDFVSGFWINEYREITKSSSDSKFWIPPHRIKYIERLDY